MKKTLQWKTRLVALLLAGGLGFTGAAQAALHDRGGGLIYDDVLEITWLWDANYGAGSAYDDGGYDDGGDTTDGRMTWDNAVAWADGLSYGGYDDWRLPTSLNGDGSGPCVDFSCNDSEMGHMFYTNMQGSPGNSILVASDPNDYLSLFENLQSQAYWSGTEYAPNTDRVAWGFSTGGGHQFDDFKYYHSYAWAVRSGDVSAVPVPAAVWLFGSGLIGLLGVARRKR